MKALKKVIVAVVALGLIVSVMPKTEVQAATALATYSFDSLDGMTDTGFGTAPSIVSDGERGNVLQFADGATSSYVTDTSGNEGEHRDDVEVGSPSSLKIANPYEGKSYTGMTISYWIKVTDSSASEKGAGVLGFISAEYTSTHPDNRAEGKDVNWWEAGHYVFGVSTAYSMDTPMINFAGLYHNWYIYNNESVDYADSAWHHIIITTDSSAANTKVYIDGADAQGYGDLGKRYNKGEKDPSDKANTLEPTLMDVIQMAGTECFIGHTGTNPTSSGVYIDDLTFWDSAVSAADAQSMFESAKSAPTTGGGGSTGGGTTTDGGGSTTDGGGTTTTGGGTTTTGGSTNKKAGTATPNLPQTGVPATMTIVGLGVAAMGAGAVLMKKKEK